MPNRRSSCTRLNRSVISGHANPTFIPACRLTPSELARCNSGLHSKATSTLFQSPLGTPFGPLDRLEWLSTLTVPTTPFADFSTVVSARCQTPGFDTPKHRGDIPSYTCFVTHPTLESPATTQMAFSPPRNAGCCCRRKLPPADPAVWCG
jgi:hypothetical protein